MKKIPPKRNNENQTQSSENDQNDDDEVDQITGGQEKRPVIFDNSMNGQRELIPDADGVALDNRLRSCSLKNDMADSAQNLPMNSTAILAESNRSSKAESFHKSTNSSFERVQSSNEKQAAAIFDRKLSK